MNVEEKLCGCQSCQSKMMDNFICVDCGTNTHDIEEYYMLKNEVWDPIIPKDTGMLCIGCVESRFGRELTPDDFLDCILNEEEYCQPRSDRLKDRMGFVKIGNKSVWEYL